MHEKFGEDEKISLRSERRTMRYRADHEESLEGAKRCIKSAMMKDGEENPRREEEENEQSRLNNLCEDQPSKEVSSVSMVRKAGTHGPPLIPTNQEVREKEREKVSLEKHPDESEKQVELTHENVVLLRL